MSDLHIDPIASTAEAETCARMMAAVDPWVTLGRDYAACLRSVSAPEREVYVAHGVDEQRPAIAGFIILNMRGAFVGYLQSICVRPEWQGQGVGTRLIAFAEARIFREVPNVFLCVSSFNVNARRLYERLGYELVGELKDYIVTGHSEFLLRKTLGPTTGYRGR